MLLRLPNERIVIQEGTKWETFAFVEGTRLTCFGPLVDGRQDLYTVPWHRLVSIRTLGSRQPNPA